MTQVSAELRRAFELAIRLAKQAGALQLRRLGRIGRVTYKGRINIVTEVDRACEQLIVRGIEAAFPDHDILAEEGSGERSSSPYRWIIDPIDGTINFAHGFPMFCVSIALAFQGEIVMGVIYDPNRRELFHAIKGRGAFLGRKRIRVSSTKRLQQALLATGFAYNVQEEERFNNLDHFGHFIKRAQAVRRPGSAAIDLAWLACGRIDGFWELFLKPWDMAAGALIVREAKGRVTSFDGGAFDLYGTEIVASNGLIHEEMVAVLGRVDN